MTRWLRRYRPNPAAAARLVCFPHAGGTASAYRTWVTWLPPEIELVAVCYPGREHRLDEPQLDSLEAVAEAAAAELGPLTDRPLAVFGHSMGASVAHEVARRLPGPAALLVSGRPAPHLLRPRADRPWTDAELVADVLRLDPAAAEVLAEPELRELLLPQIRADYRLVDGYAAREYPPLQAPVVAYGGDADPRARPEEVAAWVTTTSGPFRSRMFPGGHFYLRDHAAALVGDIARQVTGSTVGG
jgi:surfactin synthase thioesterase subunit